VGVLGKCGTLRACDGGDGPLVFVQIERLRKRSISRTAAAERAQHVCETDSGIALQRQRVCLICQAHRMPGQSLCLGGLAAVGEHPGSDAAP
jgi:hypothetical protein